MARIALEPTTDRDLNEAIALLERNDLPTADLHAEEVRLFLARVDGEVVGVGGLEVYESAALLRSLVVVSSARGEGYGTSLTRALEDRAASLGATEVYLLTTDAGEFFGDLGYREIGREEPPRSIRNTAQFSTLCPDSAVCMRRRLD